MEHIDRLRDSFPDVARDIKINLENVLGPGTLTAAQVWGTAIASAYAARHPGLVAAILAEAQVAEVPSAVVEDARAAAVLMAMNNVFYRFRHMVDKEEYLQKPARLRMQRIAKISSNKADFELFCLAVSAINGCETCVRSHEANVVEQGLTSDHVLDAVRIASTVNAAAVAAEVAASP
ncbi:MAG TPA: carboxymuconolactone decarboxylase family protein [Polyangiaceae bacterium]|jgi:alkyl hydroperoxide reductase subunit D|nr:carboxymuconolactone decarboxylase family protein [Polyangiaceae bacterium]